MQTKRTNRCSQCAVHNTCGTASLALLFGKKCTLIKAINHKNIKVGNSVVFGLNEQALLKASLALYLIPLFSLFGAAIGYDILAATFQLPHYEILTVLAGLLGLFTGLKGVKQVMGKLSQDTRYQAVILRTE